MGNRSNEALITEVTQVVVLRRKVLVYPLAKTPDRLHIHLQALGQAKYAVIGLGNVVWQYLELDVFVLGHRLVDLSEK